MDAEKNELSLQIEKLKSELKSQEIVSKRLELDLSMKQNEALASSTQFSNLTWKITQADFILNHEKKRHEQSLEMMENSKLTLKRSSTVGNSGSRELEIYNNLVKELEVEKNILANKVDELQNFNNEAKISVMNSRQVITILKKKNAAIMLKLQKRLQEAENEEKSLNYRWNKLQQKYMEKIKLMSL